MLTATIYRWARTVGVCTCIFLLGCTRSRPADSTAFDFSAGFLQAELRHETRRFDFGTEAVRPALVSGWSFDERWAEESTTFVWGTGPSSTLRFFDLSPRTSPVRLRFRCWPLTWPGAEPQVMKALVNGALVGEIRLEAGKHVHNIEVPPGVLKQGENLLEFRYLRSSRPPAGHAASKDPRQLEVAWDWLAILGSRPASEPQAARSESGTLFLPFAARLDYFQPIPSGSRLRFEAITSADEVSAHLEVEIETAAPRPSLHNYQLDLSRSRQEIELAGVAGEMARISFVARLAAGSRSDADGLSLVKPLLLEQGPKTSPPEMQVSSSALSWERPNIMLYVVDTLRADHLGAYLYPQPVSPSFDVLAADGVVFTQAYANSGWTKTSVTSILTGLSPLAHRVLDRADCLPVTTPTLATYFHQAGYQTVSIATNPNLAKEFGFARDFDHFVPVYMNRKEAWASRVNEEFLAWLKTRSTDAPFFAYLHTMEPHDPYTPPEPYFSRYAANLPADPDVPVEKLLAAALAEHPGLKEEDLVPDLMGLYDGEIADNDSEFGRLMTALKEAGHYADTLIVFVSDHGEEFRDHGHWGHGHSVYREILHVPLVVKLPGSAMSGRRIESLVQQVDIVPTLLAAAGLKAPSDLSGQSLLPLLTGESASERPALSYMKVDAFDLISVVSSGRHLFSRSPHQLDADLELYDLRSDPLEQRNISADDALWTGHLLGLMKAQRSQLSRDVDAPQLQLNEETTARLRALGYIR